MELPELLQRIVIDTTGLQSGSAGFEQFVSRAGASMSKMPNIVAASVAAPLLAVQGIALKAAFSIDDANRTIERTSGATGAALTGLESSFKKVAASGPDSFAEVSSALVTVHQRTGETGKGLEDLTKQFLDLQRITGQHLDFKTLETTLTAFNVTAKETPHVLDQIYAATVKSGIPMATMVQLLTTGGPAFRAFGFDVGQSAEVLSRFEKAGVPAAQAVRALQTEMRVAAREGKEPRQALEDFVATVLKFKDAGDKAGAVKLGEKLFGGKTGQQFVDAVYAGRIGLKTFNDVAAATGPTIDTVAQKTQSLSEQFKTFKNDATIALAPLAQEIIPQIHGAFDLMLPPVIDAVTWFGKLPGPIVDTGIALGGIVYVAAKWGQNIQAMIGLGGQFVDKIIAIRDAHLAAADGADVQSAAEEALAAKETLAGATGVGASGAEAAGAGAIETTAKVGETIGGLNDITPGEHLLSFATQEANTAIGEQGVLIGADGAAMDYGAAQGQLFAASQYDVAAASTAAGAATEGAGIGLADIAGPAAIAVVAMAAIVGAAYLLADAFGDVNYAKQIEFGTRLAESDIKLMQSTKSLDEMYASLKDKVSQGSAALKVNQTTSDTLLNSMQALSAQGKTMLPEYGAMRTQLDVVAKSSATLTAEQKAYRAELDILAPKIKEEKKARADANAEMDVTARALGITLPAANKLNSAMTKEMTKALVDSTAEFGSNLAQQMQWAGGSASAIEEVTKHAQQMDQATTSAVQGFTSVVSKFGGEASVGEQDVLDFVNNTRTWFDTWATDLQTLATDGVNQGILDELRQMGPKAEPLIQTMLQMVSDGSIAVVNDAAAHITDVTNTLNQSLDAMAVATQIKLMESTTVAQAAFADLQTTGTANLQGLLHSSDTSVAAAAYGWILKIGEMRAAHETDMAAMRTATESVAKDWHGSVNLDFTTTGLDIVAGEIDMLMAKLRGAQIAAINLGGSTVVPAPIPPSAYDSNQGYFDPSVFFGAVPSGTDQGNLSVPFAAEGMVVKAKRGGQLIRAAEAGHDEILVPTDDPMRALSLLQYQGFWAKLQDEAPPTGSTGFATARAFATPAAAALTAASARQGGGDQVEMLLAEIRDRLKDRGFESAGIEHFHYHGRDDAESVASATVREQRAVAVLNGV